MRFSTATALVALPFLGGASAIDAEGGLLDQYKAQFQGIMSNLGFGSVGSSAPVAAAEAAPAAPTTETVVTEVRPLHQLTLSNWKETLYAPVQPDATTPEEWWVLLTGRNKTCFGRCDNIDAAWATAAPKLGAVPNGPHVATLNCEDEAVLCNAWSSGPGFLYVFEMLPEPAKTDVYYKRLNLTTTTPKTFYDLYESKSKDEFRLFDGNWHPLDGFLAVNGLAVPIGYALWGFNLVPSWLFMVGVSFLSRTMMGRRMGPNPPRPGAGGNMPAAQ